MKNTRNCFNRIWWPQEGLLNSALVSVNLGRDQWKMEGLEVLKGERGKVWAMYVICAWCGERMGEKPPYKDKGETHSICDKCIKKHFPNIAKRRNHDRQN